MPTCSQKACCSKQRSGGKSEDASKLIRDNMKCPVCLEVLLPPIYQCETGHNICYLCVDEVSECPLCKSDYGDTRNYFAEELVNSMTFSCKYEEYGCKKTFLGSQLKEHQENCEFQPYRCPELACQEVAGIHQMGKHLDKHGFKVMKGDVHQASLEILDDHFDRKTEYNPWRISTFGAEFYTVSTRSRDGLWYFWTYGLGLQKDLRKFSYEIVLFSDDKQFMYRGIVQSLRSTPEDIMKGGTCLITTDNVIKSIRKNGRIKCQVYVIQGKNWDNVKNRCHQSVIPNRGKGKHQISKIGMNNNLYKGRRLICNKTAFPSSTTTNAQNASSTSQISATRLTKSRSTVNSLLKGSNLDVLKRENNPVGGCCSLSSKLAVCSGTRSSKKGKSRSRSRSVGSVRDASSVSDAEHNFVMKVRETLRCPGCYEVITPPVHQCMIGHNLCHKCRSSRQDCPLCRAPLSDSRNFFAEELLYKTFQRCVYAIHGCQVCLPSAQMRSHELICDYAPFECPFNVCRCLLRADEMFEHLQTHQIVVIEKELKGEIDVPRNTPSVPVCTIPNILKIDKIPFYPIIVRDTDGSWMFYVIAHNNAGFRYELMIKKQHKTLAFQGPVLSLRASHTQVKLKGLALIASERSIKCFKSSDKISYHVKISKIDAPERSATAKSPFYAPVSWIIVPRSGEVLSKAELFANKKTSVSPEEESDEEEEDSQSAQHNTTTDTVYFSESEEIENVDSENAMSGLEDREFTGPAKDEESISETGSNAKSTSSESLKPVKKRSKPESSANLCAPVVEDDFRRGERIVYELPSNSVEHESIVPVACSSKSQRSRTSFKDRRTEYIDANNNNDEEPKPTSIPIPDDPNVESVQVHCDINNNFKNEGTANNEVPNSVQFAWKKLSQIAPPIDHAAEQSPLSQNKADKILKRGKRCRSASGSGHRVRMSEEVTRCGGSSISDSSSVGSSQGTRPTSKSQASLHSPALVNAGVSCSQVAAGSPSIHAFSKNVRNDNEPVIKTPGESKSEENEFDELKQAIEANDGSDDMFGEVDLLTAKSLHQIVNSVISLFTSSTTEKQDSKENLGPNPE